MLDGEESVPDKEGRRGTKSKVSIDQLEFALLLTSGGISSLWRSAHSVRFDRPRPHKRHQSRCGPTLTSGSADKPAQTLCRALCPSCSLPCPPPPPRPRPRPPPRPRPRPRPRPSQTRRRARARGRGAYKPHVRTYHRPVADHQKYALGSGRLGFLGRGLLRLLRILLRLRLSLRLRLRLRLRGGKPTKRTLEPMTDQSQIKNTHLGVGDLGFLLAAATLLAATSLMAAAFAFLSFLAG